MIMCLIEVDNSAEVIENAIVQCFDPNEFIGDSTLDIVCMLLKTNPDAANCEHENILHEIAENVKGDLFETLISLFLAENKDALQKRDTVGRLPLHVALEWNS